MRKILLDLDTNQATNLRKPYSPLLISLPSDNRPETALDNGRNRLISLDFLLSVSVEPETGLENGRVEGE